MNKEKDQYIIRGVGNYQLCVKNNDKYSFIIPLNLIQEDKIIFSSLKNFLVLRHAVIEDIDFLNFAFNNSQEIYVDINTNHEVYKINDDNVYRAESKFRGKIKYISIDNGCDKMSRYKVIIDLTETELFCKIKQI